MTTAVTSCRRLAFAPSAAASFHPSRRRALVDGYPASASSTASSRHWMTVLSSESASSGDGGSDCGKTRKPKGKAKRTEAGEETFRLDRLLANRGVGTRTEVTVLIRRGKIKRADTGEVVK